MIFTLPELGTEAISLTHFPTKHQAFIFRAVEYIPIEKIAALIKTTPENVRAAAREMGLPDYDPGDVWLKKGYITIIRSMWHILPYSQLLELLSMTEGELAVILREEDFLATKLSKKPICDEVIYRPLTDEEARRTEEIRRIVSSLDISGERPFDFKYNVKKISGKGKEVFKTRMIYAFSGLYQHAFDIDSREYLPDSQLEAYRDAGINGIWTQGVLSGLSEFPFDKSLSVGYEKRIEAMRALTERLDKYGIKLYLYINEPRALPHKFFEGREGLRGHRRGELSSLCTSTREVREYLSDSIESICRRVPLLGGFFTITRSENMTNCHSHTGGVWGDCLCPRCKSRSVGEVIAECVGAILEGARRVSEDIKVFAWSWRWDEYSEDIIKRLPRGVILLSQSELDVPYEIGGVRGRVIDYSMSIKGPGDRALHEWRLARECGLEVGAKVQVNTTWEASTVPEIPVAESAREHIERIKNEGVSHLLLSWTLGGYPGRNLSRVAECFFEGGETLREQITPWEREFTDAFREFPFHITTLYFGPQNAGPSTLLFEKPTGYKATMTCFAYDDLEMWRSIYPLDVFEEQFRKLSDGFARGLSLMPSDTEPREYAMASAAYCLFKSSHNQIRFIRARDEGRTLDALSAARDELSIAEQMLSAMNVSSEIGYEAANHYYFSKGQIVEKIVNCEYVIASLGESIKSKSC